MASMTRTLLTHSVSLGVWCYIPVHKRHVKTSTFDRQYQILWRTNKGRDYFKYPRKSCIAIISDRSLH